MGPYHPTDWRSAGLNLRPLNHKASDIVNGLYSDLGLSCLSEDNGGLQTKFKTKLNGIVYLTHLYKSTRQT